MGRSGGREVCQHTFVLNTYRLIKCLLSILNSMYKFVRRKILKDPKTTTCDTKAGTCMKNYKILERRKALTTFHFSHTLNFQMLLMDNRQDLIKRKYIIYLIVAL